MIKPEEIYKKMGMESLELLYCELFYSALNITQNNGINIFILMIPLTGTCNQNRYRYVSSLLICTWLCNNSIVIPVLFMYDSR